MSPLAMVIVNISVTIIAISFCVHYKRYMQKKYSKNHAEPYYGKVVREHALWFKSNSYYYHEHVTGSDNPLFHLNQDERMIILNKGQPVLTITGVCNISTRVIDGMSFRLQIKDGRMVHYDVINFRAIPKGYVK